MCSVNDPYVRAGSVLTSSRDLVAQSQGASWPGLTGAHDTCRESKQGLHHVLRRKVSCPRSTRRVYGTVVAIKSAVMDVLDPSAAVAKGHPRGSLTEHAGGSYMQCKSKGAHKRLFKRSGVHVRLCWVGVSGVMLRFPSAGLAESSRVAWMLMLLSSRATRKAQCQRSRKPTSARRSHRFFSLFLQDCGAACVCVGERYLQDKEDERKDGCSC